MFCTQNLGTFPDWFFGSLNLFVILALFYFERRNARISGGLAHFQSELLTCIRLGPEGEEHLVEIAREAIECGVSKEKLRGIIYRAACINVPAEFAADRADRVMKKL
jgi:hypothetical protein